MYTHHIKKVVGTLIVAIGLAASLGGCSGGGGTPVAPIDLNKSLTLANYTSCGELETEIKDMLIGEMERNIDGYKQWCRYDDVPVYGPAEEGGGDAASAEGDRAAATQTNLQEAGVDEADLIKTDGAYAYAIVGNAVKIVRVWPFADFGAVATITPRSTPTDLYLADNLLIVLSAPAYYTNYTDMIPMGCVEMIGGGSCGGEMPEEITREEVYDITNPAAPVLVKEQSYQGTLIASRRIGATLYLVIGDRGVIYPDLKYDLGIPYEQLPECSTTGEPNPTSAMLTAIEQLKTENRALINAKSLADLLPAVAEGTGLACTQVARSAGASGMSLVTIATDRFADAAATPVKTAILSNQGAVYASPTSLYLTSSEMPYGWWTVDSFSFTESTVIHRFAIDTGTPVYRGSGKVEGHLVDNNFAGSQYSARFSMAQFSMSEFEGYLRVATNATTSTESSFTIDNMITVLKMDDGALTQVGNVRGMGVGENLRAARFIGNRAYIVTFVKTDPLYVVDLANPAAPAVVGELEVPGFSTYLHPLDDGHLIGLGFAADDEEMFAWTQGLKVALFDVSDPTHPAEAGNRTLGTRGSYSPAVEEHHAFTLDTTRGLLALPVEIYTGSSGGSDFGTFSYAGVIVLKADLSGSFDTVGTIVLDTADPDGMPAFWGSPTSAPLRTVIIGDNTTAGIITLTTYGVMLNRVDGTMSEVGATY